MINEVVAVTSEEMLLEEKEYSDIIFNADRDNNGKGIPIEDFIRILKEIDEED